MKVLSIFDYSMVMVENWAALGHECTCIDIQFKPGVTKYNNITTIGANLNFYDMDYEIFDIAFAFPPCTDLSVSGARWFKSKGLKALAEAIVLFGTAVEILERVGFGFIENPVSTISSYYRKPDCTFDPCDYGDPYTKKTCLWCFGGFSLPEKTRVEPTEGSLMHKLPPSSERSFLRSTTPIGFANAVFRKYCTINK